MAKTKKRVRVKYKGRLILLLMIAVLVVYLIIKGFMYAVGLFLGGDIKFDKIATIDAKRNEDNLVVLDSNTNKEAIAVSSENKTTLYDSAGKQLWNVEIGAKDILIGNEVILMATNNLGEYILLDYSGQEIYRSNIGEEITDIKMNNRDYSILMFNKGYILIDNTGEQLTKVNIEDGQVIDGEFLEESQGVLLAVR